MQLMQMKGTIWAGLSHAGLMHCMAAVPGLPMPSGCPHLCGIEARRIALAF